MHPWESLHLRSRHCAAAPTPRPLQDKASVRSACAMVWLLERTRKALLLLGPALASVEVRTSDLQRICLPGCSAVPTARAALMPTAPSSYEYRFRCHPTPVHSCPAPCQGEEELRTIGDFADPAEAKSWSCQRVLPPQSPAFTRSLHMLHRCEG